MNDSNVKQQKQFLNIITDMVMKEVLKRFKDLHLVKSYDAEVASLNGSLINVNLVGDTTVIHNLKNKTGETLLVGDEIILYSPNSSLSNIYVAIKK